MGNKKMETRCRGGEKNVPDRPPLTLLNGTALSVIIIMSPVGRHIEVVRIPVDVCRYMLTLVTTITKKVLFTFL